MKELIKLVKQANSEWHGVPCLQAEESWFSYIWTSVYYHYHSLYLAWRGKSQYDENYEPDLNPGGGPYHIES